MSPAKAVRGRIMDMGLTKGVEVYVRKVAPLVDPVEINIRGYELSLQQLHNTAIRKMENPAAADVAAAAAVQKNHAVANKA